MRYISNPQHRNSQFSKQKSQWTILESEEEQCFNRSVQEKWEASGQYWGLHLGAGATIQPSMLGKSPCNSDLYIAKFVSDQNLWHGYPVAHWLSPFDKPDAKTLTAWEQQNLINHAKKSKIHRGKKCSL